MNYESFKIMLENDLRESFPEESYIIHTGKVNKTNVTYDSITILPKSENFSTIGPTLYFDNLFEYYKMNSDYQKVRKETIATFKSALDKLPDVSELSHALENTEYIRAKLVNTNSNKEFLKTLPHVNFKDLSIVYYLEFPDLNHDGYLASANITYSIMESLNLDSTSLYNIAMENTFKNNDFTIRSLTDVVREMLSEEFPAEFLDVATENIDEEFMYVVQNRKGIHGAIAITNEEILQKISAKLNGDFYILPSSIHEVIAIPASRDIPKNEITNMVRKVNQTEVSSDEILSNNIYHYDAKKKELTIENGLNLKHRRVL